MASNRNFYPVAMNKGITDTVKPVLNILLIGAIGSGKSSLGNLISSSEEFALSDGIQQKTKKCELQNGTLEEFAVNIIDTPGFEATWDPRSPEARQHRALLYKYFETEYKLPGIHVMVFVVSVTNFNELPSQVKLLKNIMDRNSSIPKHCMMVISHQDLDKNNVQSIPDFIKTNMNSRNKVLEAFITTDMNNRIVLLSNRPSDEEPTSDQERSREAVLKQLRVVTASCNGEYLDRVKLLEVLTEPGCFPSSSKVMTEKGEKRMDELDLDDGVLSSDGSGKIQNQSIIIFTHADPSASTPFIEVSTDNQNKLRISPGHYLHVGDIKTFKAARDIKVNDIVFTVPNTKSTIEPSRVTAVREVWDNGLFCPHTGTGNMVVDGVVVSCYTDIMPLTMSHGLIMVVRMLRPFLPNNWFTWIFPKRKDHDGTSFVDVLRKLIT